MAAQLKVSLITDQELHQLLLSQGQQPLAELQPPGHVLSLQLLPPDRFVRMIP